MTDHLPRLCKQCSTPIGKGQQRCEPCRIANRRDARRLIKALKSNRSKGILPSWEANFRRDENGYVTEKLCTDCDQWKPAEGYSIRNDTASGLRSFCKPCESERRKRYAPYSAEPKQFKCGLCKVEFTSFRKTKYCGDDCKAGSNLKKAREKQGTIHCITEAKCRNCNKIKPLESFFKHGLHNPKIRPTSCSDCSNAKKAVRMQTDAYKQQQRKHRRKRRKDPKHKIRKNLSRRFHELMRTVKKGGAQTLSPFIGCTTSYLRTHIESQFKRGMNWANYGKTWHIDHIQAVSSFDHNDHEQVKACWHYSNLRPLKAAQNLLKSNNQITHQPQLLLQVA
jgi:superfamily II DNA helicase RecQ